MSAHTHMHLRGLHLTTVLFLQEGHYNYELGENISSRCE
jgi:hypothetical protein